MSEATSYEVQLAQTEAGVSTAPEQSVSTTSFDLPSASAHFWYWRVRAVDGEEFGPWSAISSLTVGQVLNATVSVNTTNNSTDDTTPTFQWDLVPGAASYELSLTSVNEPISVSVSEPTYTFDFPLLNNTDYTWNVRAVDVSNNSTAPTPDATFRVAWGNTGPADGIRFAQELQALPDLAGNYTLGGNIDLSDIASWTPIGSQGAPFTGTFDGAGYTITGLTIDSPYDDYQGLFGYVSGSNAEIIDVGLQAVNVDGNDNVGALVGHIENGLVNGSHAMGYVFGNSQVGGLVGSIGDGAKLTDSFAGTVTVGLRRDVGGLVGVVFGEASAVSGSYATGLVVPMASPSIGGVNFGGLVGWLTASGTISDSYATGRVEGGDNVGGLVGAVSPAGTVSNSYAIGLVSGTSANHGGLVGHEQASTSMITNSFYGATTGQSDTGKGVRTDTQYMKIEGTFTGWNFDTVWAIDSTINNGYPHLKVFTQ